MLIGLGFRKRAGKDTVAEYLQWQHGYRRVAFADKLKDAAKTIFGWTEDHVNGDLKEVVDEYWGFSPRWALQHMGTEAMRRAIADDIWIRAAMRDVSADSDVVITDVRFPNEADAIRAAGGVVWRVDRPALGPATDAHASETAMIDYPAWDGVIVNDGAIADMAPKIEVLLDGR